MKILLKLLLPSIDADIAVAPVVFVAQHRLAHTWIMNWRTQHALGSDYATLIVTNAHRFHCTFSGDTVSTNQSVAQHRLKHCRLLLHAQLPSFIDCNGFSELRSMLLNDFPQRALQFAWSLFESFRLDYTQIVDKAWTWKHTFGGEIYQMFKPFVMLFSLIHHAF